MNRQQAIEIANQRFSLISSEALILSAILNNSDKSLLNKIYMNVDSADFTDHTLGKLFMMAKENYLMDSDRFSIASKVKETFENQYHDELTKVLELCDDLHISNVNIQQLTTSIDLLKKLSINRKAYIYLQQQLDDMERLPKTELQIAGIAKTLEEILEKYKLKTYEKLYDVELDLASKLIDSLANSQTSGNLKTNYQCLDKFIQMKDGNFGIIAARPGMGKTAFALNISSNLANKNKNILFISLEMSNSELAKRMLAIRHKMKISEESFLDEMFIPKFAITSHKDQHTGVFLLDSPKCTPRTIKFNATQLIGDLAKDGKKLDMIVIDYIQLMSADLSDNSNRYNVVSEVSRELKLLAKELQLPIIGLSQLSRNLESRPNKRPMMSDLRESGALEQDADFILFLYSDEFYDKETPQKGITEVIIGKNRAGSSDTITLHFDKEHTRFYETNTDLEKFGLSMQKNEDRYNDDDVF